MKFKSNLKRKLSYIAYFAYRQNPIISEGVIPIANFNCIGLHKGCIYIPSLERFSLFSTSLCQRSTRFRFLKWLFLTLTSRNNLFACYVDPLWLPVLRECNFEKWIGHALPTTLFLCFGLNSVKNMKQILLQVANLAFFLQIV